MDSVYLHVFYLYPKVTSQLDWDCSFKERNILDVHQQ